MPQPRPAPRRRPDRGASSLEYALLAAAVAAVVLAVVVGLASLIRDAFQGSAGCVARPGRDCPAPTATPAVTSPIFPSPHLGHSASRAVIHLPGREISL
jgi:Flp pilus assembly pilin Flp